MPTREQMIQDYRNWLSDNENLKGTDDYNTVMNDLKAMLDGSIEVTPDGTTPDTPENFEFSLAQTARNFFPSLKNELTDVAYALLSPKETAKSLINLSSGIVQKYLIPGEQSNEIYADAMAQYFKDKYASGGEAFLKELQNNPAGVLSDASMFIGIPASITAKGASVVNKANKSATAANIAEKAGTVSKVGASIDPFNVTLNTLGTGGLYTAGKISDKLGKGDFAKIPETFYESAVKPSMVLDDATREQIIKTGLENEIVLDRGGINKARNKIADLSDKINKIIDVEQTEKGIPTSVVKKYLGDTKKEFGGFKYHAKENLDAIADVEKRLDEMIKKQGEFISPRDLQDFKTDLYKQLDYDKMAQRNVRAEESALKGSARGAKETIAELFPEVDTMNTELGNLLEAEPVLSRAQKRIRNRDQVGIGIPIKTMMGSQLGGGVGGVLGATLGLIDAPITKSRIGIDLYNRINRPGRTLLDNSMSGAFYTGPATRGILGTVGDVNLENDGLLAIDDIKQKYGL